MILGFVRDGRKISANAKFLETNNIAIISAIIISHLILTILAEAQRNNGRTVPMKLAQSFLVETVPYIHVTIRATGGECVITLMEAEIHFLNIHLRRNSSS